MGMKFFEFAQERGVTNAAVRLALKKAGKDGHPVSPFRQDAEMTAADLEAVAHVGRGQRSARAVRRPKAQRPAPPVVAPAAAPVLDQSKKRDLEALAVLFGSSIVTLASLSLTNLELYNIAQLFGLALGIGFAAYLFLTVVVARNRMKGNTSARALKTLLICEGLAGVLHAFNFYRQLAEEIPNEYIRAAAALLVAVFAVFISFESVLAIRNYNAEVPDANDQQQ